MASFNPPIGLEFCRDYMTDEFQPALKFEIEEKSETRNIKTCKLWKWASASLAIEYIVTSNVRHFRMAVANKMLKQKPFL